MNVAKKLFEPNENDVNNYLNAEYWRLKYFRTKGNYGSIIVVLATAILCIIWKLGI